MKGKMIARVTLIGLLCSVLVLLACTPPQSAAPAPATQAPGQAPVSKGGWQEDWEKTLAAARTEGNLSIYTAAGSEVRTEIGKWFKEKFGLEIEWTPIPAAQTSPKVFRERQAGLYLVDIQMGALSRQIGEMKPAGILAPIKPLLILPEVLDKNVWFGGDIPWVDNDKAYTLNNLLSPEHRIAINTNLVKPDEVTSYNDLLNPKWKGKLVLIHPILNSRVPAILHTIMGPDYLRKLAQQQPVITENQRLGFEWVAQGKYPIMLFSRTDEFEAFRKAGAPVAKAIAKEGTTLAGGAITFSMVDRGPHRNATKIFVNWWLGKELGTQLSKFLLLQSARVDVPTDHLPPDIMRVPGVKYVNAEQEDFQDEQAKLRDGLFVEIFGAMLK